MRRNDTIALGLSAAVVTALLLARRAPARAAATPPRGGTAEADALRVARGLIATATREAAGLPAERRAPLAQALERAAEAYVTTSPMAARELLDAAEAIRTGRTPAAPPAAPAVSAPAENLTVDTSALLRKADAFFRGVPGVTMDRRTLTTLDDVAVKLAAWQPDVAARLVDVATKVYERLGIERPASMTL